ncbi:uncharacterized protein [Drosophila bipectinata]|uniref:uncharacterized protein isoform X2 n=1 Tax=Drosophila bipectinata TaxID=42026 RepID=UPI0038B286C6
MLTYLYNLLAWIWTRSRIKELFPLVGITDRAGENQETDLAEGKCLAPIEKIKDMIDPRAQPADSVRDVEIIKKSPMNMFEILYAMAPGILSFTVLIIIISGIIWYKNNSKKKVPTQKPIVKMCANKSVQTSYVYSKEQIASFRKRKIPQYMDDNDSTKKNKTELDAFEDYIKNNCAPQPPQELLDNMEQFQKQFEMAASPNQHGVDTESQTESEAGTDLALGMEEQRNPTGDWMPFSQTGEEFWTNKITIPGAGLECNPKKENAGDVLMMKPSGSKTLFNLQKEADELLMKAAGSKIKDILASVPNTTQTGDELMMKPSGSKTIFNLPKDTAGDEKMKPSGSNVIFNLPKDNAGDELMMKPSGSKAIFNLPKDNADEELLMKPSGSKTIFNLPKDNADEELLMKPSGSKTIFNLPKDNAGDELMMKPSGSKITFNLPKDNAGDELMMKPSGSKTSFNLPKDGDELLMKAAGSKIKDILAIEPKTTQTFSSQATTTQTPEYQPPGPSEAAVHVETKVEGTQTATTQISVVQPPGSSEAAVQVGAGVQAEADVEAFETSTQLFWYVEHGQAYGVPCKVLSDQQCKSDTDDDL